MERYQKRKKQREPEAIDGVLVTPSAVDVEQKVLGALLLDQEAVSKVLGILTPESFFSEANRLIYEAVYELFSQTQPADGVMVIEQLKKSGKIDQAGGVAYIAQLTQNVTSAANVEYYARVLQEKNILRQLIAVSNETAHAAYLGEDDAFQILDHANSKLMQISQEQTRKGFVKMSNAAMEALEYIEHLLDRDTAKYAVKTGYYDLDNILNGFQKSDLIILAARPAMGKTALALSLMRNVALLSNAPVAIFSLEMSRIQLMMRLIAAEARMDSNRLRKGNFSHDDFKKLATATSKLRSSPIFLDDGAGQTIMDIRAKSRRLVYEHNVQFIIIDYLQLIRAPEVSESREREIAYISMSLKAMAKDLNIPVMALSQLNREVENQKDNRPQLSNLRESGAIEQDADVVMFIHRPEYYMQKNNPEKETKKGLAEIIIAKHRNGPTGEINLNFIGEYSRFESFAGEHYQIPESVEAGLKKYKDEDEDGPF
ncbi:MAG: replicative DNA helicase [Ignavibacteriales bacterium]